MSETDERVAFEAWAGTQYRNAETYTARDFKLGLSAWQACAALSAQRIAEAVAAEREACARHLDALHEQAAGRHNYYACAARELRAAPGAE